MPQRNKQRAALFNTAQSSDIGGVVLIEEREPFKEGCDFGAPIAPLLDFFAQLAALAGEPTEISFGCAKLSCLLLQSRFDAA
jgi:hypothetical protein